MNSLLLCMIVDVKCLVAVSILEKLLMLKSVSVVSMLEVKASQLALL